MGATKRYMVMKLTSKQESFAKSVATGEFTSLSAAYSKHYKTNKMKPATIHQEASKLAANPKITHRINELRERIDRATTSATLSDRDKVLEKLRVLLDTREQGQHVSHQLRAAQLLGQSIGMFKDVVETQQTRSADDIRQELQQRLALATDDMSETPVH